MKSFFSKHHHHHHFGKVPAKKASIAAIIFSLSVGMFFSPCIELESYYFTAGTYGWKGIVVVSLVYLTTTVGAMVGLVAVAIRGVNRFNFDWLEKNEKAIIGVVLIIIGIIAFFVS